MCLEFQYTTWYNKQFVLAKNIALYTVYTLGKLQMLLLQNVKNQSQLQNCLKNYNNIKK